ncbi:hypothetical protein [Gardnerella leopoldii]|uniref:hypothetical protein n=1 Tax=Gardnerella leopoldii TaxID=2792978 RepID=UPI0001D423F8|nr:hypothetical protein [Gardnerella leopoldii]EFH27209.1 hypothetical protein GVAMD_0308 [Gardnerella vaginalis AMD]RFT29464.1 hypothetical protein CG404_05000 [Bifidobacteriaceae bacterium VN003]
MPNGIAVKLKKFIALALSLFLFMPLCSGCSNQNGANTEAVNSAKKVNVINAKVAALYKKVLANADKYNLNEADSEIDTSKSKYSYALVNMSDRDIPELILRKNYKYVSRSKVFAANKDYSDVVSSNDLICDGVGDIGGFRASLSQYADSNSLSYVEWSSGTGDTEAYKVTMNIADSNPLKKEKYWSGIITDLPKQNTKNINFVSTDDTTLLDNLAKTEDNTYKKTVSNKGGDSNSEDKDSKKSGENASKKADSKKSASGESLDSKIKAEKASGRQVVSGTVRVLSYNQVLEAQNIQDPNPGSDTNQTFMILILDNKTSVTLHHGGDMGNPPHPSDATMMAIDDGSQAKQIMEKYVNKKVYISFTVNDGVFPSDTGLPLGEPRLFSLKVIE